MAKHRKPPAPVAAPSPQPSPPAPQAQVVQASLAVSQFAGPLPHPHILQQFNLAIPDGAERIMRMAEAEAAHRRDVERKMVDGHIRDSARGSWLAFAVAMAFLGVGVWCLATDREIGGVVALAVPVSVLVSVFVNRYRASQQTTQDEGGKP